MKTRASHPRLMKRSYEGVRRFPFSGSPCGPTAHSSEGGVVGAVVAMDAHERLNEAFAKLPVYDRQVRRINYTEYRRLHADPLYRFLARDLVNGGEVVTAWLGLDQGDGDEPWIFGTVTLSADGTLLDDEEIFSATEDLARATHAEVLARRASGHSDSAGD
jgi:hypothetical protein